MTARRDDETGGAVVRGPWPTAAKPAVKPPAPPGPEAYAVARPVGRGDDTDRDRWVVVRLAARLAYQTGRGHAVLAGRAWDAASHAAVREQVRLARALGDSDGLREWQDRLNMARSLRWQRIKDVPAGVTGLAFAVLAALTIVAAILIILGAVVAAGPFGLSWGSYWSFWGVVFDVAAGVATVAVLAAPPLAAAAWLRLAHRAGRDAADLPAWLAPAGTAPDVGGPITPSIVVTALRDLGIPTLRKAVGAMGDAGAGMLGPIKIAGCGVEVDVALPSGTSTEEVQNRRRKLAENLNRHEHELHITIPQAARTVRLWIAESGALDEPIGPSPLVLDPETTADYYTGRAPWGEDLRGDAVSLKLLQCHLLITGLSNQGKTASLRALALWLAFDPTVEFRIGDLKGAGDWRMFGDGIATTVIQGSSDEDVIPVTEMVEEVVREMERRLAAVERSGAAGNVTRDMARSGQGFHPLVCIVDEAQRAYMCPLVDENKKPYGGTKHTSRFFMACRKLHNQGRAVNVILWQGTQDPTDENFPKLVREGAHIRAALVLGSKAQAEMALGEEPVAKGAAPHKLRKGLDKGTLVVTGEGVPLPPNQPAITVRTHYIDGEAADEVAGRAKLRRARTATRTAAEPEAVRDELADVAECMRGEKRVLTEAMVGRLRELDPAYYEEWSTKRLKALLASRDLGPRKAGRMYVDADDIRLALTAGDEGGREGDREADDE